MSEPLRLAASLLPLFLVASTPTGASASAKTPGLCIATDRIVTRTATDDRELTLELAGGQRVRSRLAQSCPHLAELDSGYLLEFDHAEGSRLCGGDRFRVIDPVAARSGGAAGFPWCRLGALERIAPDRAGSR